MRELSAKLASFDLYAEGAVDEVLAYLSAHREEVVAVARARLIEGHYRYGDRLMYEYDQGTLRAEALQELADAVNYAALWVERDRA